jgi:hypothetical protein
MPETLQAQSSAAPASPNQHRRLRNYLLNLRYQLRFTLTIVVLAVLLTVGLGYFVMSNAHEASRVVKVQALDPTDLLAQQLAEQFAHRDHVMLLVLIGFGVLLALVLAGYGIVLTHKVAGPLFKVGLYLDHIRDGRLGQVYNLRKGDQLVDFFEHFRAAHDALRRRTQQDIELLDKAIAAVGAGALADELGAARQRKVDSLK